MSALLTLVLASLVNLVDPTAGICGRTVASVPFGMVQAGPEKLYAGGSQVICGFTHTPSDIAPGDMLMMPVADFKAPADSGFVLRDSLYASAIDPALESAAPGFYAAYLTKPGVRARITAGHRTAVHEYTYRTGSKQQIVIDLNRGEAMLDGAIGFLPGTKDVLLVRRHDARRDVYYRLEFSSDIKDLKVGNGCALLTLGTALEPLCVIVGVSGTSLDNASAAIEADWAGSFDEQLSFAEEEWNDYLSTLRCPVKDSEGRKRFYTALYRTALQPMLYSDATGDCRGMDGKVHNSETYDRYTLLPLTFTARELYPLLGQISPRLMEGLVRTIMADRRESGRMPEFELFGKEYGAYGYNPAGAVIAEALRLGADGFGLKEAAQGLIRAAFSKDPARESFRRDGFVTAEDSGECVRKTLEFAYEDWCLAQVAEYMAEHSENDGEADAFISFADSFTESAQYWRNVFDPVSRRMRGRVNGRWAPLSEDERICCFDVPQDIIGLTRAMGGPSEFCARLDSMMTSPCWSMDDLRCRRIPHLYAMAGRQEKSDSLVAKLMADCFSSADVRDSFGTLSAWYVRSALGEYQICPGAAPGARTFIKKTVVAVPVFEMTDDSSTVEVSNIDAGCTAWYRCVYEDCPEGDFILYDRPFTVSGSCTLEVFAESLDGRQSPVGRSVVRRIVNSESNN